MSYAAFALNEFIGFSGIVASLQCGITMNHYTRKALSTDGRVLTERMYRVLADISETLVFFQVGEPYVSLYWLQLLRNCYSVNTGWHECCSRCWRIRCFPHRFNHPIVPGGPRGTRVLFVSAAELLQVRAAAMQAWCLARFIRCVHRKEKLRGNYMVMIWHAGLRGAIAFAVAQQFPSHNRGIVRQRF